MENESKMSWRSEFMIRKAKIVGKLNHDFDLHLQNVEDFFSERDEMLDKKEEDVAEKLDELDKREKTLNAREKDLGKRIAMFETERKILEEDRKKIANEKEKWTREEEVLLKKYRLKDNVIKLKVGEKIFNTYRSTVMRDPDSMLAIRFGERHNPVMVDGAYFFDRDPKYFSYILNYLRDGNITAESLPRNKYELYKILKEADYYQLRGLKEEVEKIIQQSNSNKEEAAKMTMGRNTMRRIAQDTIRPYSAKMDPDEQKAIEVARECRRSKQDIFTFPRGTRNKTGTN